MFSDHATVRIGEYEVPLIGVPKDATQEKCSKCGSLCHVSDIVLDEKGQPCCQTCLTNENDQQQPRTRR